ncbi:MAG: dTMP kinase [Nitrosomonadaceae bacterium]|nr:dTMP kinase [Nitrosomonadaceae bacterium]
MAKGKLITIEGSEGGGKTTQLALLAAAYKQRTGETPVVTREPGGTPLGEEIRKLFKDPNQKICPEAELLLLQASRAQLVREVIKPALAEGRTVICDRYIHSTLFYQGFGRALDQNIIAATTLLATDGVVPDLVLVLQLPFDKMIERVKKRGNLDRMENEAADFFRRVQLGVEWLANSGSPKVAGINADQPIEAVQQDIIKALEKHGIFGIITL